ncbi:hypothetical protein TCAL_11365 [Tigriopus californicus]|uniref:RING-type domain-containing protein n=1 Tax=Tigriopus californicus TaxID=6832 RepID=A0A553PQP0_TIGCA|nr:hypothetical protein TCAL_11365 [Tigriopus californicus]|eukprot:TCALIF_11365-PA protein Name:"Similar to AMFR E3 ubiquitin-protein ligase AMFR (Homo sapiens)" AED:0.05 eAED:0.05 QI:201/0.8/0.83/1/0.6/0.66/6/125/520
MANVERPASVYGGLVAKIKRHPRVFPRVMCLCRALGHLMVHISLMARIDPQFWPRALPILELDMEKTRGIFMSQSFNDVLLLFGLPFSFGSDRLALPILQDVMGGLIWASLQFSLLMETSNSVMTLILCFIKLLSLYLLKVNYNLDSIYMSVVLGIAGFLKINTYEDPLNTGTIFLITFWCYCLVRNVPSFLVGLLFSVEEMLANNQNPTAIFHEYVVVDFTSFMIFGGATGLSVLFSQWNGLIEDPLGLPQWVMEHLGQTPMGVITMALSFCALSCITNKWFRAALNYLANIPFLEDTINKGVYPGLFCVLLWLDAGRKPDEATLRLASALSLLGLWTGTMYMLVRTLRQVLKRDLTMRPLRKFACTVLVALLLIGVCVECAVEFFIPYFKANQHSLVVAMGCLHIMMASHIFTDTLRACIYYIVNRTDHVVSLMQRMDDANPERIARVNDNCSVCWSSLDDDGSVKVTPCDHLFHNLCLQSCLYNSSTCPMCRYEFGPNNNEQGDGNDTEDEVVHPEQ